MMVYFSEDKFDKHSWGRPFREVIRRLGHLFVWWYPVTTLILSVSAGLSFQLPNFLQTPYWLTIFLLLAFYLIWTFEGFTGRKVLGKRSVLDKPIEVFLELGRDGALIIAEALADAWKRVLSIFGHSRIGLVSTKRLMAVFTSGIEVVVVSYAYFGLHLFGLNLLYAFGVPLWIFIIIAAFIGLFKRRHREKSDEGTANEDRSSVSGDSN